MYGLGSRRNKASEKIASMINTIEKDKTANIPPFAVCSIGKDVKRFAQSHSITVGSDEIYISKKFYFHSQRAAKGELRLSKSDYIEFPMKKRYMAKFYDGEAFVYTDFKVKFIVKPNFKIKTPDGYKMVANLITAGKVTNKREFNIDRYERIE